MRLALRLRAHEHRRDALVGADVDQVVDRHALGLALALRHLVHTQLEDSAALGEEEHRGVRVCGQQVQRVVLFARAARRVRTRRGLGPFQADTAAFLSPEHAQRLPLHVAAMRERDHDLFLGHQVFSRQLRRLLVGDLGPAVVAVLLHHVVHLFFDQEADLLVAGEDALEVGDGLDHLFVLLVDLAALEARQPAQGQGQHRLGLPLAQPEPGLQLGGGDVLVGGAADRLDHLVEVVEADLEALRDVGALLRLVEIEPGAADDDVAAVVDEQLERLLEAQHDWAPFDDREHDHAERRLQRRVLVEVVQDAEHLGLALQLDHDAHPVAVGLVPQVGDAFQLSLRHQLGDLGHQGRLVHCVGKLVDDDALASVGRLLQGVPRADHDAAMARRVRGLDAGGAHDRAAGRKVGTLDERQQVLGGGLRIVNDMLHRGTNLAQVVGRDVGRHAHGDARCAVDKQVRDASRKD